MNLYIYKPVKVKLPLLGLFMLMLIGCTDHFERLNTNPYEATEEMMQHDNLATGSYFIQMQRNVFPIAQQPNFGDEVYQTMQNLAGDVYSGYMGASNNWYGGSNHTTYNLIPQWYGQAFDRAFLGIMSPWNAIKLSSSESQPEVFAMATIVKIVALQRTTDMYGPLPYLNFGSGSLQNPYDSQQEIYDSFFEELDHAIDVLTDFNERYPGLPALPKYDFIYGGNIVNWIKFGNSLKLRLAMRIVYADPVKARTEAESAVNHPVGVFAQASDIASLKQAAEFTFNHPLYIITFNFDDIRMGANMDSYLKGYNDPRLSAYFNTNTNGEYIGIRNGINISNRTAYSEGPFSTLNIAQNSPIVWMNPAEVYFLRAEGALRGWNMGGNANALYEEGISTSFNVSGVTVNSVGYINDDTSVPAPYADPVNGGNSVSASSNLLSQITIKWDEGAGFEENLERIITQKWIAIFPDGQEAWSEFRRTGYPKVFPVAVNNSGGLINTAVQIRRLPFPVAEYQNNSAGVNRGVSLLGGGDNGGTRLWWDKKGL